MKQWAVTLLEVLVYIKSGEQPGQGLIEQLPLVIFPTAAGMPVARPDVIAAGPDG